MASNSAPTEETPVSHEYGGNKSDQDTIAKRPIFFGRLSSAGPSGPPPNFSLPPNPPANANRSAIDDIVTSPGDPNRSTIGELVTHPGDPNRSTIGRLVTYPSPFPDPSPASDSFHKSLTINLRREEKLSDIPQIINTPASTPSPISLTHPRRESGQETGTLEVPKPGDKPVPMWLRAAIRKFPQKKDTGEDVVQPLNITRKSRDAGSRDDLEGNGKGSPILPFTVFDLDTMLGLSPKKPKFDDFLGPQEPLFVGMAGAAGSEERSSGNGDGKEDSAKIGDGGNKEASSQKKKKKRSRRSRSAKGTASGTEPGRSGSSGVRVEDTDDGDDDEKRDEKEGGKGEDSKGKPVQSPLAPSTPETSANFDETTDEKDLPKPITPSMFAEPRPDAQSPPVAPGLGAATLISSPGGQEAAATAFATDRLAEAQSGLAASSWGPAEGSHGNDGSNSGGGTTSGESGGDNGGGSGRSGGSARGTFFSGPRPGSSISTIPPRREIQIPAGIIAFREYARREGNTTNNDIQRGLATLEATFRNSLEPAIIASQETLRLGVQVRALEQANNALIAELSARQESLDRTAENAVQVTLIEEAYDRAALAEQKRQEAEEKLAETLTKLAAEMKAKAKLQSSIGDSGEWGSEEVRLQLQAAATKLEREQESNEKLQKKFDDCKFSAEDRSKLAATELEAEREAKNELQKKLDDCDRLVEDGSKAWSSKLEAESKAKDDLQKQIDDLRRNGRTVVERLIDEKEALLAEQKNVIIQEEKHKELQARSQILGKTLAEQTTTLNAERQLYIELEKKLHDCEADAGSREKEAPNDVLHDKLDTAVRELEELQLQKERVDTELKNYADAESGKISREECFSLNQQKETVLAQRIKDLEAEVKAEGEAQRELKGEMDAMINALAAKKVKEEEEELNVEIMEELENLARENEELRFALAEKDKVNDLTTVPAGFISEAESKEKNNLQLQTLRKDLEDQIAELKDALAAKENAEDEKVVVPEGFISESDCDEKGRLEQEKLRKELKDLARENADLTNAIVAAKKDQSDANFATKTIAGLQVKDSGKLMALTTRITELEKEAKEKDSIAEKKCQSEKDLLSKTSREEKAIMRKQIEKLTLQLKAFTGGEMITRKQCEIEKEITRTNLVKQFEALQKKLQVAEEAAKSAKPGSEDAVVDNKILRERLVVAQRELQACRDDRDDEERFDNVEDRIVDHARRIEEVNAMVAARDAQLAGRGINTGIAEETAMRAENARLILEVQRLESIKTKKVASGFMLWDEKDDKIQELRNAIAGVNQNARDHFYKEVEIYTKYNKLAEDMENKIERQVRTKLLECKEAWKVKAEKITAEREERAARKEKGAKKDDKDASRYRDRRNSKIAKKSALAAIEIAKQKEIEKVDKLVRESERDEPESMINNPAGTASAALYRRGLVEVMIKSVRLHLVNMVAARALNGKQPDDSITATSAGDTALRRAEENGNPDLIAQAYMWAGIAAFYHGESQRAANYLGQAQKMKNRLRSETDRTVLALWINHKVATKASDEAAQRTQLEPVLTADDKVDEHISLLILPQYPGLGN
ncbi:uncharacterized protein RCO7_00888 [Rhynchosporium graminicola]|uniref:Uncharacterized protein n=1 Tax=Rhynchosporium graminicola TaxID=2792576 RepID=A0A1E1JQB6_9HELO|nr:uncharacterized protein RCO7_00888 [Rhynchosporium commune]